MTNDDASAEKGELSPGIGQKGRAATTIDMCWPEKENDGRQSTCAGRKRSTAAGRGRQAARSCCFDRNAGGNGEERCDGQKSKGRRAARSGAIMPSKIRRDNNERGAIWRDHAVEAAIIMSAAARFLCREVQKPRILGFCIGAKT